MKFILPNRQHLHNGFGWNLVFGIALGLMLLVEVHTTHAKEGSCDAFYKPKGTDFFNPLENVVFLRVIAIFLLGIGVSMAAGHTAETPFTRKTRIKSRSLEKKLTYKYFFRLPE